MGFILASSSESRLNLLRNAGLTPTLTVAPDIDETPLKKEEPRIYARRMSESKLKKVSDLYPDAIILSADTVATCGALILPKALSIEDVIYCISKFSGRRHRIYTSLSLYVPNAKVRSKTVVTAVKFKRLTQEEIVGYANCGEGIGKAGGYSIQGKANLFIHLIIGSVTNVIGLPMYEAACLLKSANIAVDWNSETL